MASIINSVAVKGPPVSAPPPPPPPAPVQQQPSNIPSVNIALANKLASHVAAQSPHQQMPTPPAQASSARMPTHTHHPAPSVQKQQQQHFHVNNSNQSHPPQYILAQQQHQQMQHFQQMQQMQHAKREVVFPVDSVEAYQPVEVKKRKINSRDISKQFE